MTQFDVDPRHFPAEAAPDTAPPGATAAAGATRLHTTVSPTDVVVAPFRPFDDVDVFEAAAHRELAERHHMRQPVDVQVGQVLAVIDPAVGRSLVAAGARSKSLAELFALLRYRCPTAVSGAAKRAQLGRNRWTNSEDAVTNMDQLEKFARAKLQLQRKAGTIRRHLTSASHKKKVFPTTFLFLKM